MLITESFGDHYNLEVALTDKRNRGNSGVGYDQFFHNLPTLSWGRFVF